MRPQIIHVPTIDFERDGERESDDEFRHGRQCYEAAQRRWVRSPRLDYAWVWSPENEYAPPRQFTAFAPRHETTSRGSCTFDLGRVEAAPYPFRPVGERVEPEAADDTAPVIC